MSDDPPADFHYLGSGNRLTMMPAAPLLQIDGLRVSVEGTEILRGLAARGTPPVTVKLVDWADEEGARFGRSLFGSSACAGTLDPDAVRDLRDREGERLEDVVARFDVDVDRAHKSGSRLDGACAYLPKEIP